MELAINRKRMKFVELFIGHEAVEVEETVEECSRFAYKRSLLFYTAECKCCRHARAVTNATGERQYICACAAEKDAM